MWEVSTEQQRSKNFLWSKVSTYTCDIQKEDVLVTFSRQHLPGVSQVLSRTTTTVMVITNRANDLPAELTNELIDFTADMILLTITAVKQICLFVLNILDGVVGHINQIYRP
ncbi:hypothetical protein PoB_000310200 [Plakobranchus ocellatus]|uniref:Uncharacterized protein n=1 Tax=Plakobranchus ocellatus TaxID=259542 RepID=A0AAV3Y3E7_9GAST|nr:hypothetical protein PoB_000310200 [Plakobranchus ocellatus]